MKRIITLFICLSTVVFSANYKKLSVEDTSKAFTQVGKKAIPAVVFIKSQYKNKSGSIENYGTPFDFFNDEFFKHFFGQPPGRQREPQMASGSGFIVSKDGYILTNYHVVKDAGEITVTLNNGDEFDAKLIGSDAKTDLAVLKIESDKDLPIIEFGDSDVLEIGEWAIAIGSPFQFQSSLTVGVVSAKGRQNLKITDFEDFIQTDAAINPGNSGGPLLNIKGDVIGINTAIISQSGGYMGIGFAIPSNMAKNVMDQIIESGSVRRGFLGIFMQPVDKQMAEAFDLETTQGVLITEVNKNSAAEKAGLKQGDIILSYDDIPIKSMSSFRNEVSLMSPGKELKLTIMREGKKQEITVTLGNFPDEKATSNASIELGIEVSEVKDLPPDVVNKYLYNQKPEGIMITSVKYDSLADKANLKPGMIILQINHRKIENIKDFNEAMNDIDKNKHVLLLVRYQNVTRFITIKIK